MTKIHISKLDAATRQLETAIRLFIAYADPVSIHTLASASQEILETLAQEQGIKSQRLQTLESVKEEYKNNVRDRLSNAKNFFKHADRDPNGMLGFNPNINDFVIWDAGRLYFLMTQERIPLMYVFDLWIRAKNPEWFLFDGEQQKLHDQLFDELDPDNRAHFFTTLLELGEEAFTRSFEKQTI